MSVSLLKRSVNCGRSISSAFIRQKHTLITGEGRLSVEAVGAQRQQPHQQIHQVVVSAQPGGLPPPPSVLMPPSVQELQASEKAQFSPHRTRDTSSARIAAYGSLYGSGPFRSEGIRESHYNVASVPVDRHVDVYDCSDTVSLDNLVQTNVPNPYGLSGQAPSQFSSPDCHGAQDDKYVSGDLQDHHQSTHGSFKKTSGTALDKPFGSSGSMRGMWGVTVPYRSGRNYRKYGTMCSGGRLVSVGTQLNSPNLVHPSANHFILCDGYLCANRKMEKSNDKCFHTCITAKIQGSNCSMNKEIVTPETQLTARQKLQRAVKEYGATVIVFHITISLASLGICYLLVSSGVDMTALIKALGINLGTASDGATAAAEVHSMAEAGATISSVSEEFETSEAKATYVDSLDATTKTAAGAATFVVAYAVHKVFAPARIGITLTATPFIVRHLRRIGFLKPPKP